MLDALLNYMPIAAPLIGVLADRRKKQEEERKRLALNTIQLANGGQVSADNGVLTQWDPASGLRTQTQMGASQLADIMARLRAQAEATQMASERRRQRFGQ